MKLTEIKKAPSINATDIIHVVSINDKSQDPQGSSYKAEIGQIIALTVTPPITVVNTSNLFSTGLIGTGVGASGITYSNFLGPQAGQTASNAGSSNFLGNQAGKNATRSAYSNFLGDGTGVDALDASNSNFMGYQAGYQATYANGSNFLGFKAGKNAFNASYSTLIGYNVGNGQVIGSVWSNNIIIGTNISLQSGTRNSINLGGVLFGINTYATTTGEPSIVAQTNGKIGINVVNPTNTLHVYSEAADTSGLRLERLTSSSPTFVGQPIGVDASGDVVRVDISNFTNGLTANTISATTYLNLPINLQKTIYSDYEISNGDNNYSIMVSNDTTPVTITIPSGLLSKISVGFIQQGSADVTIAAAGGSNVTIRTPISGAYKIKGINYNAYIEQVNSSNVYQLLGNLKA